MQSLLAQEITQPFTLLEVLSEHWWIALVAFGISLIATPIFRMIAYHFKIVDRPDDLLKPHSRPIAYLGGLGICAGLLAGLVGYALSLPNLGDQGAQIGQSLAAFDLRTLIHSPL